MDGRKFKRNGTHFLTVPQDMHQRQAVFSSGNRHRDLIPLADHFKINDRLAGFLRYSH